MAKKGMREVMPTVAAFIDVLRAEFGADQIDPAIKAGMAGAPNKFWASEGGIELGTSCEADPLRTVTPTPDWTIVVEKGKR